MPRNRDVATVGSRRHHTPKRRYNLVVQAKHSLVIRCGHPSYTGVRATLPRGGAACTRDVKENAGTCPRKTVALVQSPDGFWWKPAVIWAHPMLCSDHSKI